MTWLATGWPQIVSLALMHLALAVPAILLSVLVAVPLGRIAQQNGRGGRLVLAVASLLYSVPALPLLVILPALLGIPLRSPLTMIVALTLYGVALLVRTAADAFHAVDPQVRRAAVAIGHSQHAMFWRVELPLAVPVLVSGVRVVTVSTIGLVTIGALVGIPSLGTLFTDGFQRGIDTEILAGIGATILLALMLDALCALAGRALAPWHDATHRVRTRRSTYRSAFPAEIHP